MNKMFSDTISAAKETPPETNEDSRSDTLTGGEYLGDPTHDPHENGVNDSLSSDWNSLTYIKNLPGRLYNRISSLVTSRDLLTEYQTDEVALSDNVLAFSNQGYNLD